MCCIFTCFGWMLDLVQRVWTFTMSCCIGSAVCCALFIGAISGIALGYNYSLAEYIDLKETNVSVYLKRGVFDDEVGEDMDWRRSGHMPVAGHIGEHNLRTGEPESSSIQSGRRLDDSLYESDDRNRFEGSLMRLTAEAPAPTYTTESETTVDTNKILSQFSLGSMDHMKAIESLANLRKTVDSRRYNAKEDTKLRQTTEYVIDERYLPHVLPINPNELLPGHSYKAMHPIPVAHNKHSDSARYAVPQEPLNEQAKWRLPKLPPEAFTRDELGNFDVRPTYPMPVTQRAGPVRPTRPKTTARPRPTLTTASTLIIGRQEPHYPKSIDEEMDTFKDKIFFDAPPNFKDDDFIKNMKGPRRDDDDYRDAIRGIPMRKKRHSIDNNLYENVKRNESSINNTTTGNVKNHETKDIKEEEEKNSLLYRLSQYVTKVLYKEIDRKDLITPDKLKNSTNPGDAITKMSSSNEVFKLLGV